MDSNTFMGLFIGALVVILGLAATISALVVRPIIHLNQNITKLNLSVENLNTSVGTMNMRITKHGEEIDSVNRTLTNHEGRISKIEGGRERK